MLFGVGVSCRILYSTASYLYVSCSGSITSVGEERANLSAIVYYFMLYGVVVGVLCRILYSLVCCLQFKCKL